LAGKLFSRANVEDAHEEFAFTSEGYVLTIFFPACFFLLIWFPESFFSALVFFPFQLFIFLFSTFSFKSCASASAVLLSCLNALSNWKV
jgi:hypothetical protein